MPCTKGLIIKYLNLILNRHEKEKVDINVHWTLLIAQLFSYFYLIFGRKTYNYLERYTLTYFYNTKSYLQYFDAIDKSERKWGYTIGSSATFEYFGIFDENVPKNF